MQGADEEAVTPLRRTSFPGSRHFLVVRIVTALLCALVLALANGACFWRRGALKPQAATLWIDACSIASDSPFSRASSAAFCPSPFTKKAAGQNRTMAAPVTQASLVLFVSCTPAASDAAAIRAPPQPRAAGTTVLILQWRNVAREFRRRRRTARNENAQRQ